MLMVRIILEETLSRESGTSVLLTIVPSSISLVLCSLFFSCIGLVGGGAIGAIQGLKKAPNPSMRIRFNSMLNGSAKLGSTTGNMLGVLSIFLHVHFTCLAIMYAFSEKIGEKIGERANIRFLSRGNDYFGPVVCGFTTGAVFKSTGRCCVEG